MRHLFIVFIILFSQLHLSSDELSLIQDGEMITTVNRSEFSIPIKGEPFIDYEKLNHLIEQLENDTYIKPHNAILDHYGKVVPEQVGYKLDRKAFEDMFITYFYNKNLKELDLPMYEVYPKVDSELLANIRTKQIAQYVTYFNRRNKARAQNISLAIEALNNYVVFPGEVFSFNKVVGERTLEKGYLPAKVIIRGELYDGVGGGICQVSSTLFNAVDRAGVQILERYSHSRRVSYVPPGRDATVSWYGPDFTFKNTYNQPILLQGKTIGGTVVIRVFSSNQINYEPRYVPRSPEWLPLKTTSFLEEGKLRYNYL